MILLTKNNIKNKETPRKKSGDGGMKHLVGTSNLQFLSLFNFIKSKE